MLKINLHSEPETVERMIRFIYQCDYDDGRDMVLTDSEADKGVLPDVMELSPQGRPTWNEEALVVNAKVFIFAMKCDMEPLMKHAAAKYREVAGELYGTRSFQTSIRLIYARSLRLYPKRHLIYDVIADVVVINAPELLTKKSFRTILARYGDLTTEVLLATLEQSGTRQNRFSREWDSPPF